MTTPTAALSELVAALNKTNWSSWQTTEPFSDALEKAEQVLRQELVVANADNMLAALIAVKEMVDKALPQFNWGASCLDANAIRLLNDVPRIVSVAIRSATGEKS